jgi:hypothetical protein
MVQLNCNIEYLCFFTHKSRNQIISLCLFTCNKKEPVNYSGSFFISRWRVYSIFKCSIEAKDSNLYIPLSYFSLVIEHSGTSLLCSAIELGCQTFNFLLAEAKLARLRCLQ